jgi:hypothetical protein
VVVAFVQFNVDGASVVDVLAFLKVTTTTNVFADDVTVRFVVSRRAVLVLTKVEAVNSLFTRAIAARAGAAHKNMATPRQTDEINRHKRFKGFFRWLLFIGQFCILLKFLSIFLCGSLRACGAAEQHD